MTEKRYCGCIARPTHFECDRGPGNPRGAHVCPRRIYVNRTPSAAQLESPGECGHHRGTGAHDTHFSFGETSSRGCLVPNERFRWLPTRQPVALDLWTMPWPRNGAPTPPSPPGTTRTRDLGYQGDTYLLDPRNREFLKFVDLPLRPQHPLRTGCVGWMRM